MVRIAHNSANDLRPQCKIKELCKNQDKTQGLVMQESRADHCFIFQIISECPPGEAGRSDVTQLGLALELGFEL